jgi:hypothetical protein
MGLCNSANAVERAVLLVWRSIRWRFGLKWFYVRESVDVFVQLELRSGQRWVSRVLVAE